MSQQAAPASPGLAKSLANRLIHPAAEDLELQRAISDGALPPELLESQCLDARCVDLLRTRDADGMLSYRADLITAVIRRNVQRHALFGFRDGPELRTLLDDEEISPDAA